MSLIPQWIQIISYALPMRIQCSHSAVPVHDAISEMALLWTR
jgi:hypothetical protein